MMFDFGTVPKNLGRLESLSYNESIDRNNFQQSLNERLKPKRNKMRKANLLKDIQQRQGFTKSINGTDSQNQLFRKVDPLDSRKNKINEN